MERPRSAKHRAFTLIEIMVVLAIIAILITISVVVAGRVSQGGRISATQDIIRVLDQALASYTQEREGQVPAVIRDDAGEYFMLADGRADTNGLVDMSIAANPSLALFLQVARDVPSVDAIIKSIDPKFVGAVNTMTSIGHMNPFRKRASDASPLVVVKGVTILDAWQRPIRFVHPAWDGGGGTYWDGSNEVARDPIEFDVDSDGTLEATERVRRSYRPWNMTSPPAGVANPVGDADEGMCVGGTPYFYSAGPDGDPGTRQDNVYTTRPTFPPQTEKLQ